MAEGIVARGKKSVIRWFQREDVDSRQRWPRHSDPLYSHNDPRPMSTREGDLWFLERGASSNYRMFAVDDFRGNLIGWITLRNVNLEAGTSVLGIAVRPDTMDLGFGTDALVAFLGHYFGGQGFREMWLDVAAFNHRAMRCYEKCGFRYVGKHWMEHPSSLFPPVFSDERYREVRQYFRRSLLGIEVQYHDMMIDRAAYLRHRPATESKVGGENGDPQGRESERVHARRLARR